MSYISPLPRFRKSADDARNRVVRFRKARGAGRSKRQSAGSSSGEERPADRASGRAASGPVRYLWKFWEIHFHGWKMLNFSFEDLALAFLGWAVPAVVVPFAWS